MSLDHQDIDRLTLRYRKEYSPSVEAGLERLHRRLDLPKAPTVKRRVLSTYWRAIAAAAVVVVAASLYLFSGDGRTYLTADDAAMTSFNLPDGSVVVLQRGGEISYVADDYNHDQRRLWLRGQAYFSVEPDHARPFLVNNGDSELRVTGTAFNLRAGDSVMEVEVSEGAVVLQRGDQDVVVKAWECGLAEIGKPLAHKPAPNLNHHAWRTGTLKFHDTPIDEVLTYFSTNWGIEYAWVDGKVCDYRVSGSYSDIQLEEVLATVAEAGGTDFTVVDKGDGGKRYVFSSPCES